MNVGHSSLQVGLLTAQVGWLGLKVGSRLALTCICHINHMYGALESVVSVLRRHRNCRGYYYYYYYYREGEPR